MTTLRVIAVVCTLATLGACSKGMGSREAATVADPQYAPELAETVSKVAAEYGTVAEAPSTPNAVSLAALAANQPDRYLIKNATLVIETENARDAADRLGQSVAAVNGYVSTLRETENAFGNRTITIQVRVPADRFEQGMLGIETLGKILSKNVTADDVTDQYVDTDARSRNLKQTEERLLDHLGRTGSLDEVLKIENELTRVREEVERLDGRLRFLSDRIAFSTIGVTLQERARAESIVPAESFSTGQVASQATRALVVVARMLWVIVIWIVVWVPVWLPVAVVWAIAWRRHARRPAAANDGAS